MSLDDLDNIVLAGTRRSLLCSTVNQSGSFQVQSETKAYNLFGIDYYPFLTITTNSSRVIVHNITNGIARLDFNPILTSDGDEYIYKDYAGTLYGLIHLNVTSEHIEPMTYVMLCHTML